MASKSTTSTAKRKTVKHEKPHRDFALFPHQAGVWAKKIKGRLHYFGSIKDDPQGTKAIARYDRERGYLEQGQTPPPPDIEGGCTLRALCNRFLESKRLKCDAGELSLRSYKDYRAITDLLIAHFGKLSERAPTEVDAMAWRQTIVSACEERRSSERSLSSDNRLPDPRSAIPALQPAPPVSGNIIECVLDVIEQIAEAVDALHEHGVIHRDIKPGNIMITPEGQAILMDLGFAKLADEINRVEGASREIFAGTIGYASPEQVGSAESTDRQSDIYSLGVTLWEMLALRKLYPEDERTPFTELMRRVQFDDAESVRKFNPRVDRDLDAIVHKCIEKRSDRRYSTVRAFLDDLRIWHRHEPVLASRSTRLARTIRRLQRNRSTVIVWALSGYSVLLTLFVVSGA